MTQSLYPVTFHKILQANHYTAFILSAENKKFAIYTAATTGETIQRYLANKPAPRPQTHDLLASFVKSLDINLLQLIITRVEEGTFYCRLFLEQTNQGAQSIVEIDIRPSDGLILSLSHNLPIYCTNELLTHVMHYDV